MYFAENQTVFSNSWQILRFVIFANILTHTTISTLLILGLYVIHVIYKPRNGRTHLKVCGSVLDHRSHEIWKFKGSILRGGLRLIRCLTLATKWLIYSKPRLKSIKFELYGQLKEPSQQFDIVPGMLPFLLPLSFVVFFFFAVYWVYHCRCILTTTQIVAFRCKYCQFFILIYYFTDSWRLSKDCLNYFPSGRDCPRSFQELLN